MIDKLLTPNPKKIIVVGDAILDHYIYGVVDRISPEAPIPVVKKTYDAYKLGGAANVWNNLITLGAKAYLISATGADEAGSKIYWKTTRHSFLLTDVNKVTPVKTRVIGKDQQLLRIDTETTDPLSPEKESDLLNHFLKCLDDACLVIISDYGKGVITPNVASAIIQFSKSKNIPVFVDPHNGVGDFSHYCGATMIKANKKQVKMLGCADVYNDEVTDFSLRKMWEKYNLQMVMITLSEKGLSFYNSGTEVHHIKNTIREMFDVTGAGDSTLATFAYAYSVGIQPEKCAELANLSGNISVQYAGTYSVTLQDLISHITHTTKIVNKDFLQQIKKENNTVVFVNGCFDLLHPGHLALLQYAKQQGDILVVGLNSDASVRALKGESRPVILQEDRAKMLEALSCVDYICIFDEATPVELIKALAPDIHVKGSDHQNETDGVPKTLFFDRVGGFSTTGLIADQH